MHHSLKLSAVTALLTAAAFSGIAAAQSLDGCPSEPIRQRFEEFGQTGRMPPDLGRWLGDPKAQYIEPYKAFDNVHYVGVCWVSAWAIRTREGVILLDTLHDPFTDQLVANLRKVGIDPTEIKIVLMTHGHFDHAGGAYKIKALAPAARFMMTAAGWKEALDSSRASQQTPRPWTMIAQDTVVKDGDVIRLGEQSVTVLETPGHTYGTASYLFDAREGDKNYRAVTVGGLGLNAIEGSRQVEAYISSIDRLLGLMGQPAQMPQVHLTTHAFSNGLTEAAKRLANRQPGSAHPLVDPDGFRDQLRALRAGAVDRLAVEKKANR